MKIHIVQKGDTLWKIAKKYGVDFETLKKTNTQLTNPDLIMPGMKIKVPSSSVHVKKNTGAGSAPPKEYVKEVQQKEFAATPTPLGIEDEEEAPYQSAPITQQPAMQQTQKEMQMKPQKEMPIQKEKPIQKEVPIQKEKPIQKEVPIQKEKPIQKEIPIQKPPAVEKPAVIEKPPVVEKVEKPVEKESTKFSVNILPQPPQPPIKPAKDYKISDVIKKGSELIAPQIINKMKPNNIVSPQTKKENVSNIVSPQTQKENVGNIVAPQTQKENVSNVVSPQVQKENVGNIVAPDVTKESLIIPQVTPPNIMPM
ncbi:SafA/ExsA family spore coat assembly protein, partial [Bacillus pseudomycoides]|uniref:SafA/ExsA family spore coat assembly protein n=1 Tax=Bacillus pseudomycoides TaxID=64104 RepID=UPI000BED671A